MNTTTNEQVIRVGLVDDQNLVRTGFAMVIDSQPDMQVVVEAANGKLATERLEVVPTDVVLMDIRMPVMDGLEATRLITEQVYAHGVNPKIIILTSLEPDLCRDLCYDAGADDFINKPFRMDELDAAIGRSLSGQYPAIAQSLPQVASLV